MLKVSAGRFPGYQQVDNLAGCFMLLFRYSVCVDVHRGAAVGMTKEFLGNFDIDSQGSQVGRQRMPERVPSDYLPLDPRPLQRRSEDLLERGVGRKWLIPSESRGREEKVSISIMPLDQSWCPHPGLNR